MDYRTYKNLYRKYYPMMAKEAGMMDYLQQGWNGIKRGIGWLGGQAQALGQRAGTGLRNYWNRTPAGQGMRFANATDKEYYGGRELSPWQQVRRGVGYGMRSAAGPLNAIGHQMGEGMEAVGDFGSRLAQNVRAGKGFGSVPDAFNYARSGFASYDPEYEGQALGNKFKRYDELKPTYGGYGAEGIAGAEGYKNLRDHYRDIEAQQRRAAGF